MTSSPFPAKTKSTRVSAVKATIAPDLALRLPPLRQSPPGWSPERDRELASPDYARQCAQRFAAGVAAETVDAVTDLFVDGVTDLVGPELDLARRQWIDTIFAGPHLTKRAAEHPAVVAALIRAGAAVTALGRVPEVAELLLTDRADHRPEVIDWAIDSLGVSGLNMPDTGLAARALDALWRGGRYDRIAELVAAGIDTTHLQPMVAAYVSEPGGVQPVLTELSKRADTTILTSYAEVLGCELVTGFEAGSIRGLEPVRKPYVEAVNGDTDSGRPVYYILDGITMADADTVPAELREILRGAMEVRFVSLGRLLSDDETDAVLAWRERMTEPEVAVLGGEIDDRNMDILASAEALKAATAADPATLAYCLGASQDLVDGGYLPAGLHPAFESMLDSSDRTGLAEEIVRTYGEDIDGYLRPHLIAAVRRSA